MTCLEGMVLAFYVLLHAVKFYMDVINKSDFSLICYLVLKNKCDVTS